MSGKKGASLLLPITLPNASRIFKILLQTDLAANFWQNNVPSHLKCVVILPCEMLVVNNCNDPELSEANFHAILSHSKQLLKNIHH